MDTVNKVKIEELKATWLRRQQEYLQVAGNHHNMAHQEQYLTNRARADIIDRFVTDLTELLNPPDTVKKGEVAPYATIEPDRTFLTNK